MDQILTMEHYVASIENIVDISNTLMDGWTLKEKQGVENNKYITKRYTTSLTTNADEAENVLVTFEYHVVYNLSYGVPVLCFKAWKQDGSLLSMEEYWALNQDLNDSNVYDTLTQLDHPVLCQPFLTLHPCRTQEIIQPFLQHRMRDVYNYLSSSLERREGIDKILDWIFAAHNKKI